jgi:glycosyltransferase involved in cell wall biosynthesis
MKWAELHRRLQPYAYPRWLERWHVRSARRSVRAVQPLDGQPRRLFVDVGVILRHDAGTGIQRTVRAVASKLVQSPPPGWEVVPVGATRKRPYHRVSWPDPGQPAPPDPIETRPGDVFLGLDFSLDDIHIHRRHLARLKRDGMHLWFVMYDLLPMQRPDWFSDRMVIRFRRWLRTLAALADGYHCISHPVETELRRQLADHFGLSTGFRTSVLPMGWDISDARHSAGLPVGFDALLSAVESFPTALMVGTLEPRKGHADVLAAFDCLWRNGHQANLVIVGREGWKNEALQKTLREHPMVGRHLFWLRDASDEALLRLYESCDGVIAASLAEGFGLPLLEALGHGIPVLAREIPVFRLHEHRGVSYFPVDVEAQPLADTIEAWFEGIPQARASAPGGPVSSWSQAADFIVATLEEEAA